MIKTPIYPKTCWFENMHVDEYPSLNEDMETEVAIIGGGITGITCLYLLNQLGITCSLFEGNKLFRGTTSHTTAKVTFQHNLFFDNFSKSIGKYNTELYAVSNLKALDFIKETIGKRNISCDFIEETSYVYTCSDKYMKKIEDEVSTAVELGFPALYFDTIPLPIDIKSAVGFKKQYRFHPIKYMLGIINSLRGPNKNIYENSRAVDVIDNKNASKKLSVIFSNCKKVSCNYVISATHFPFVDGSSVFFSRLHASGSYVVVGKTTNDFPGGIYIDAEHPRRSVRPAEINGEDVLLFSGESHISGRDDNTSVHYNNLQDFGNSLYSISEFSHNWYTHDIVTLDKVPYVGKMNAKRQNIFVATGYNKWGMTNSTNAAILITDIIMNKKNPYEELYSPSRFTSSTGIVNFFKQNITVAEQFLKGKTESADKINSIPVDSSIKTEVNGNKVGIYKDELGVLHIINTTCTHMGCELNWNDAEKSWDCPCHGSRFSIDGEILECPSLKPLQKYDTSSLNN
ncbi:FAD-dependent oxidoreductase [Clostridium oryzae]|uniref:Cytochrome b6-f complex iron-sulfur subunit n=1 Tax=Clostridium oryzae TaxID=1450648 RepID=A0A1V4IBY1_9CLOT|nr:FAD-dependent oxidoreductase [Clostridium oryzae]OPJ57364.1 cytochrome b6-f complex iron-sulfur subunit [Clostridium oryzae]